MLKRIFDILFSLTGLLIFSPIFLAITFAIYIKMGKPIFFIQQRPGLLGEPFLMYKFRSMTTDRDANGFLLSDESRMIPLGRTLRKTSLDELPELFNVLKGDMSLVGPRPLLMKYLDYYTPKEAKRHDVRPGITGLAQINGRNMLSWNKRLALDVKYVTEKSFFLDLKILCITLKQVVHSDGVVTTPTNEMQNLDDER